MTSLYTEKEVRTLITEFVYRLTIVNMDDEEAQLFLVRWLRNPETTDNDDFERLYGYLFDAVCDVNSQDEEDIDKLC